jgi:predicted GNAT superfamily acetyltransferase
MGAIARRLRRTKRLTRAVAAASGLRGAIEMPKPRLEVRLLETPQEFRQCELIQRRVWDTLDVGSGLLIATQKHGGIVIGTLVNGRVAGFLCAFLARYRGRLIHWSHMMAVEAPLRDQGCGLRMKLLHRKIALERGIPSICWTYDPLQSRNAKLNITRLGAVVEEYVPDCYGHFPSLIEKGLLTDRFVVNWRIGTARVERRLRGEMPLFDPALARVNETRMNAGGFPENRAIHLALEDPRLLVEIPSQTDAMRSEALPLARRWRLETRRIFQRYLAAGFHVEDFIPPNPATEGRGFYLLRRHRG